MSGGRKKLLETSATPEKLEGLNRGDMPEVEGRLAPGVAASRTIGIAEPGLYESRSQDWTWEHQPPKVITDKTCHLVEKAAGMIEDQPCVAFLNGMCRLTESQQYPCSCAKGDEDENVPFCMDMPEQTRDRVWESLENRRQIPESVLKSKESPYELILIVWADI